MILVWRPTRYRAGWSTLDAAAGRVGYQPAMVAVIPTIHLTHGVRRTVDLMHGSRRTAQLTHGVRRTVDLMHAIDQGD